MQQNVERKQLLSVVFGSRNLSSVQTVEIRLEPGQRVGRHLHDCPVVGYIAEGTAVYQIEGEEEQTLSAGTAFYEPAKAIVSVFGNASDSERLRFIAFYLLDGAQELITMLD